MINPGLILIVVALVLACMSYIWPTLPPAVILLCIAALLRATGHV
jgi:hypothetical protein